MLLMFRQRDITQKQRNKVPGMQGRGYGFFNRTSRSMCILQRQRRISAPNKYYLHRLQREGFS